MGKKNEVVQMREYMSAEILTRKKHVRYFYAQEQDVS